MPSARERAAITPTITGWLCPLDDLPLSQPTVTYLGDNVVRDSEVGGHVHVAFSGTLTCGNGHEWGIRQDVLLQRII